MATYTSTSGNYKTTLTVTETATSIPNNTSTLSWSLKVERIGGASQYGIHNANQCPWSVSINGSRVGSGTFSYDFRYTGSYNLGSGNNVTVAHNNDGTKTGVAVSGTVDLDNSPYAEVMTASGTIDLTTIPRASDISLSVGSYNVTSSSGNAFTYTITAKSTSFYNRLRYTLGSTNYTGSGSTGSRTGNFTNAELLNSLPTATSGSLIVYVDTATDSGFTNIIGTNSVSIPISINTSYIKPSITLQNLSVNSSPISGYAVAGYSKVQCGTSSSKWSASGGYGSNAITVTFTTSHGSLAQSSYSASSNSISNYTVTNVLPSSSSNYTLTITATARDSRGATSSASKTYTVYGYTPPTANLTAYRVASSGSTAEDGAGTFAYVAFSGAVSSSVNSQNTLQSVSCSYSGSISGTIAGSTSQTTSRWLSLTDTQTVTFTVTVRDKVTSSTATKTISTAQYPLDLYDDGNGNVGVGLGGLASSGYVFSPLHASLAQQTDGVSYFSVGTPDKETGRTYSYFRAGGGTLYFGNGEKGSEWVGWLTAINQAGTSKELINVNQSLDVNFLGNATSATTATNAESVNNTLINPTSATTYYVPFVNGTGYQTLHQNDGLRLLGRNGTASVEGYSELTLGNGIANGTADNKTGWLRLHAPTGYYAEITMASNASANRIIYFPNISGTLAIHDTTLWTGKLLGGTSQAIDMSAYSRIRVYAMTWGVQHVFEIDLSESGKAVSGSGLTDPELPWQGGSTVPHRDGAGTTGGHLTYYSVSCKVNTTKTTLWITSIGYQNIQSSYNAYVQALNNGQYYVYRVDGII